MTLPNLSIDLDRFWGTIEASAAIGPGRKGGLRRLALDAADAEMRRLFIGWCEAAGCTVRVDRLGSIFARRAGRDESLAPVLIGSHLDTQVAGGRYDGIVGVLAGLEVLRSLDDLGIETERPIEVVNWTNEEGARFTPPMMASQVFAGRQTLDWALARTDESGVTVAEALTEHGLAGDAPVGGRAIDSYFELHIEQGPALEAAGAPLGIVNGGYVARGLRIGIEGDNAHSGPTPMHKRRNALVGAAQVAVAVDEIGWRFAHLDGKTTVARLEAWPNKPGILSSEATLFVDFRSPDAPTTDAMESAIRSALPEAARRGNCAVTVLEDWTFGGPAFDPELMDLCRRTAERLGVATLDLMSQAGHDAYHLSHLCPSVLLFSPCVDGISHNEAEATTPGDQAPAATVLLNAVAERAGVARGA